MWKCNLNIWMNDRREEGRKEGINGLLTKGRKGDEGRDEGVSE